MDEIWKESNRFKKDCYQVSVINRISKKGGSLALMYGKSVTVTKVDHKQHTSFESAHWRTIIGKKTMNILSLYHPILSKTENYQINVHR